MSDDKSIHLNCPSLLELFDEARELCTKLDQPFDMSKIIVTTDYGTKVVIYYEENN